MRDKGFLFNRLFDGFVCGAFIISDKLHGGEDVFWDDLVTYDDPEELKELIDHYLTDEAARIKKCENIETYVINEYCYQKAIEQILRFLSLFW